MRTLLAAILATFCLLETGAALAQESASFTLSESVLDAGGHPQDGVSLSSGNFRVSLHSVGEGVGAPSLTGVSFMMQAGFAPALRPAGEVANVRFFGASELVWDPEPSVGEYALYRGVVTRPFDPGYGECAESGIVSETAIDPTSPPIGGSFFYLVTARNRLREEGTKGAGSDLTDRPNSTPCP